MKMDLLTSNNMKLVSVLLVAITLTYVATDEPPGFTASDELDLKIESDLNLVEKESGGTLRQITHGHQTKFVDLDNTEYFKRVLCRGQTILIALKKDVPSIVWKPALLVVSKSWSCNDNAALGQYTIFAVVENVEQPKENFIKLQTREAWAFDMLDDIYFEMHYEHGPHAPSRQKRFISEALGSVDWSASFVSDIAFNEKELKAEKPISMYKSKESPDLRVDTNDEVTSFGGTQQFLFQCSSCHGLSQVSYDFELKVKKVDKKPQILKYRMELKVDTTIEQRYNIDVEEELSLTKSDMLWRQEPEIIFETILVKVPKLEPIMLKVNFTGQANLELVSRARNKTHYSGDFTARGSTVISQMFEPGQPIINEVTSYNWTVVSNDETLDTNSSLNTTFAVFQNMTLTPLVSWAQKDVDFNLGPPVHLSIRPKVNVISTSDGTAHCFSSSVSIDSNVSVTQTDFSFDAFGFESFHNWSAVLMNRLSKRMDVIQQPLMDRCQADCHGFSQLNKNQTMEEACGYPSQKIIRGDENFKRLRQLWGDYILFASEEAGSSFWCGSQGRNCVSCLTAITGDDNDDDKCADRMVNSDLAASLTRLAKLIETEWGDRKLLVSEAWDEPTSEYPEGRHGDESVFYEGRGTLLTLTRPNPDTSALENIETETDSDILSRFTELAVCSNFKQVTREENSNIVGACVAKKPVTHVQKRAILSRNRRSGEVHHPSVKSILFKVGAATSAAKSNMTLQSELTEGTSYPPAISMERACGDITGVISQDNIARMERLVEYPLEDVLFNPEGPLDNWCGVETRRCRDCTHPVDESYVTDTWNWCGTRTMSMRMAVRLQRLSVLTDGNIAVRQAHTTRLSAGLSELYAEGRAAIIELLPASSLTTQELTSRAKLAGFDYVSFPSPNYIEVCVKIQDGLDAQVVMFPLATLVAVPLPLENPDEYAYPSEHAHETRRPLLFDNSTSPNEISEHFKLHMFLSPGVRFLRLDPTLVDLLELAYDVFKDGFYILPGSGYRPRSVTLDNINGRHEKEKYRFQMGQACEIKPSGSVSTDNLFRLSVALMKASTSVQTQGYGIGIGAKGERLYFHVRRLPHGDKAIEVWDSGNALLYEKLKMIEDQISRGGFIIPARADDDVCATPVLGLDNFYFGFDLDQVGHCWSVEDDFCSETEEHRRVVAEKFQDLLAKAAGSDILSRGDIMPEIENCIVNTCGGCPEAGEVWNQKVMYCTTMVQKYLSKASVPFRSLKDKVAIFNTENTESTVHAQACGDGRICVENIQIYSLLRTVLNTKYMRDTTEELLFGGTDNPSPLLEIVEQELAWRAEGNVDVFVDRPKDITALRNVLKIIMMLNKNVSEVTLHIDPDINQIDVTKTFQRQMEEWSLSVCPQWSRVVVTPYKVKTIPYERKRRSIEQSKERNKMKLSTRNWELDWVLKA